MVANPEKRAEMSPQELAEAQKVANERMRAHWKVVDGELMFDGEGDSLCTAKDYGDFEMYVDWKILEGGDSGIYLRGSPQVQIWDTEFEKYHRLGADKGSGALWNNKDNPRFPLVKADNPAGEWNTFYIKMVGDRVTVKLNDQLVTDNVVMENVWDRDSPIYPSGQIELQNHGNTLWFRNIYLRELDGDAAAEKEVITPTDEPISLLNGENLDGLYTFIEGHGYEDPNEVFTIKDGMLHISGEGYGGLITEQEYRDYHLIIEYKCTGPKTGEPIPTTLTAEITKDRDGEKAWKKGGERITLSSGRINWWGRDPDWEDKIGFRGKQDVESPLGEWTRMDAISDGDRLRYEVNGVVVNEAFDVSPVLP